MPVPLLAASTIASLVPAAIKLATGNKQDKQAERIRNNTHRPVQGPNSYLTQNLALAKNRASANMPGYGNYLNQIGNNAAGANFMATEAGQDPNAILSTIAAIDDNSNKAVGDLNVNNAQYRDRGYAGLIQANNDMAEDERQRFEWNNKQKYNDAMAAASALDYGSIQNKFSGINDIAKTALGVIDTFRKPGDNITGNPGSTGTTGPVTAGAGKVNAPVSAQSMEQAFAKIQQANPNMNPDQIWAMIQGGVFDEDLAFLFTN